MPRISPKQESFTNNLNELLTEVINKTTSKGSAAENDDNQFGWIDIIEFCESSYYLGLKLYPWQRLILKLFYMDTPGNRHLIINEERNGCQDCVWNNNTLRENNPCLTCSECPTEKCEKYVQTMRNNLWVDNKSLNEIGNSEKINNFANEKDLLERDLTNDSDSLSGGSVKQQILGKIGKEFSELLLVLGRRAGKSLLVSIIALYESYKLIEIGNPQLYFGNLNEGDTITILNVAVSEMQAKEAVFDKIKPLITGSAYFKSKISPGSLVGRSVRFLTARDKEINEQLVKEGLPSKEGTIYLLSGHSNSDSLVGKTILIVIIDEMASMVGKDGSKMSDEELYIKLKNSVLTFGSKGKIICISNPLTRDGKFFELYEQSFVDDRILMIQLPSYIVNPTLNAKDLEAEKHAAQKSGNYEHYKMQIEARFSGGAADPFIPPEFVDVAFQKGSSRRRAERGNPNLLYFMHLDPANNSDNYALSVVHIEEDPFNLDENNRPTKTVIVDHINMWQPSELGEPVNISDVDQYVIDLTRRFNIVSITYDQWESASSSQLLQRMGLPARITPFSSTYKQMVYSTLRNLFFKQEIEFYQHDGHNPDISLDTYGFSIEAREQFKFLGRKYNKKGFSVFAAEGHYDDIPDCIAGAAYVALNEQHGYTRLPTSRTVQIPRLR